jgi:hypothetical protein
MSNSETAVVDRTEAVGAPAQGEEGTAAMRDPVAELERELASAKEALAKEQQRAFVERLLFASSVTDVDAARRQVEKAIAGGLDVKKAVAQVRQRSPQLFRSASVRGAALAPAPRTHGPSSDLEAAQREALAGGDRKALLRYLRLRRNAG